MPLSLRRNHRISTEAYDANGNLTNNGTLNVYDFENRLVQRGGFVYDGDGNRVQETVSGVTTRYLVPDKNLTGYAQVIAEFQNSTVSRAYTAPRQTRSATMLWAARHRRPTRRARSRNMAMTRWAG